MHFILRGHGFENEIQTITQVFYPNEKFIRANKISSEGITAVSVLNKNTCTAFIFEDGRKTAEAEVDAFASTDNGDDKELKHIVKLSMFQALKKKTGMKTPWGILTGIRPSKIAREILISGGDENGVIRYMSDKYLVEDEKIQLCLSVAKAENEILKKNSGDFSIYIGIPFCPTRCLYCSFTSYPISKYEDSVYAYLEALKKELALVAELTQGKRLDSVYIGGGTPTSLDEKQLEFLLLSLNEYFDNKIWREFTVEAGRPDTLNRSKLDIMKQYDVTRLSINPQTMDDETLRRVGRGHTSGQFLQAYEMAREAGHNNINLDLILGLPGETVRNIDDTFRRIEKLAPKNITVHTLAVKRASKLKENLNDFSLTRMDEIEKMLEISAQRIKGLGMKPYYMYRQKNMLGNFENVGYCSEGYECIYNVQIMEERQTIFAVGAGAVTKIVDLETNKIDRVFNVKNIDDYILRIDEMMERKRKYFLRK